MGTTVHCCNSVSALLNPRRSHSKLQPKLIPFDSFSRPGDHPLLRLLDDYNKANLDMARLKQIHALMLRLHLFSSHHPYPASKLLTACSLSSFSQQGDDTLAYALRMFDQIPQPNLYCWNTIIRAHASLHPQTSILLFSRLLLQHHLLPDNFTFPFVLKAAARLSDTRFGAALHGMVFKSTSHSHDIFILNSLIHFYSSCGHLSLAFQVFVNIPHRDVVSWNSIIAAFAQAGHYDQALELFQEMQRDDVRPNDVTMVSVLSACGMKADLDHGRRIHSYIDHNDIPECLILNNVILDMYVKCGGLEEEEEDWVAAGGKTEDDGGGGEEFGDGRRGQKMVVVAGRRLVGWGKRWGECEAA